ncbi:MAG TPA: hypothetical protein VF840_10730 [Terriglobales bacterium]
MQVLVFCVIVITALMVYFPVIFIRKMNRLIATIERVEANTRSATTARS